MRGGTLALISGLLVFALRSSAAVPGGYVAVAQAERVPPDILYAIACAESGRPMPDGRIVPWPWALNIGGEGRFFQSRAQAYQALTETLRRSTHVDIGLGQINWYWHRDRFSDAWAALDPYQNLQTAARVLREQFDRCRCNDWWLAVERYHAPGDTEGAFARRSRYRKNVERCWRTHTGV